MSDDKSKLNEIEKGVVNTEVSSEMKKSYLDYAMSVIVSRAIPSVEDGLKPVQRRILYSMSKMGLKPNTATKKSARIVGDVIGKYHPHGDQAVYDTMVRLAQDFSMRYPLVFGQGNFGSIDGDDAAAYRYTEAKLKKTSMELLEDMDKDTVKFASNFDSSLKEPTLLPGKFPNLILNGATGIAVGMSTNIPPHNLNEICDAIIAYIKNSSITVEELSEIVTGPDFPTGGVVSGEIEEMYKKGKGSLILRGRVTTEKIKRKKAIVITEIPYMLDKSKLITQIAKLVRDKKIKNISGLRDESSKGKIRIVIELKKRANPKFIINRLYKYTRLQDSFNANIIALIKGQPKRLNLREIVEAYVEHRKLMITNRSKYLLDKAENRLEIVEGLLKALKKIDNIIKMIKNAKGKTDALNKLKKNFKLSQRQSEAVLDLKLQQLTSLEKDNLTKEEKELKKTISNLKKILGDVKEILKIITEEVKELKEKYGDERRTKVLNKIKKLKEKDLVQKKDVVVTITKKGYCKRIDVKKYKEQKRGGKGVIGSGLTTGDFVKQLIPCSTHDYLMFFTSRGRVLWLKAYDIPQSKRYGKGKAIVNLLKLKNEYVTNVISVKSFEGYLFMATKQGKVKRISLKHFSRPRSGGIKAIKLPNDNSDELIGVEVLKENQEVFLATRQGKAIRFNADDIRPMSRSSYGVIGIKIDKSDEVVSLEMLDSDAIMTITEKGYGKRTALKDYRKTARAGKGVINLRVSKKTGNVVNSIAVDPKDSIIITTAKGMVIRTNLKNIRVMGRATQGVKVVKLQPKDRVTDIVKVVDED
ncbi:DNA gyrase subunit A [Candidatus Pacearchaeota archaeon]|nr:DNA gyrase subunit A [Candidatus Pacearchaeota archaeon]